MGHENGWQTHESYAFLSWVGWKNYGYSTHEIDSQSGLWKGETTLNTLRKRMWLIHGHLPNHKLASTTPKPTNLPKFPSSIKRWTWFRLWFDIILQLDEQLSVRSNRKPLFKRWKVAARLRTKSRQFLSSVHHASLTAQKRWEESPMKLCRAGWHTHVSENPCQN